MGDGKHSKTWPWPRRAAIALILTSAALAAALAGPAGSILAKFGWS